MAVYKYSATIPEREHHEESGTVVARDEEEARGKLRELALNKVHLKKLGTVAAFFAKFTANVV